MEYWLDRYMTARIEKNDDVVDNFLKNNNVFVGKKDTYSNYWYHGTSHASALSILDGGILFKMGGRAQDFSSGDGFYLSSSFTASADWAKTHPSEPCVLTLFGDCTTFQGLNLFDNNKDDVIKYYRSYGLIKPSIELENQLENVEYVIGPSGLCIRSRRMAQSFVLK